MNPAERIIQRLHCLFKAFRLQIRQLVIRHIRTIEMCEDTIHVTSGLRQKLQGCLHFINIPEPDPIHTGIHSQMHT